MIHPPELSSIRVGNRVNMRGALALYLKRPERPQILGIETSPSMLVTLEAATLSLTGSPAYPNRRAQNS